MPHAIRMRLVGLEPEDYMGADINNLLDLLEQLVNRSKKVAFSSKVMVDEEDLLEIVDQLRATIPDEILQAKRMLAERERVLEDAQKDAERVLEQSREEALRLVDEQKLLVEARKRADRLLMEAEQHAEGMRLGADEYAADVLGNLEQMLSKLLTRVQNGLSQLEADRNATVHEDTSRDVGIGRDGMLTQHSTRRSSASR